MELSWAECKNSLALAEKKVVDAPAPTVVSDIITASVSLEQAQLEASVVDLGNAPDPALTLQGPTSTKGKDPSKALRSKEVGLSLVEGFGMDGHSDEPPKPRPE